MPFFRVCCVVARCFEECAEQGRDAEWRGVARRQVTQGKEKEEVGQAPGEDHRVTLDIWYK